MSAATLTTTQEALNYARVATAIAYLRAEQPRQPSLAEVAARVHLSPEHFQRTFTAWAGVSPKAFARYLTVEHAKALLAKESAPASLFDVTEAVGLSSASRLYDAFVRIEAVTPGEFRGGGTGLRIAYSFVDTPLGTTLIASTGRGVCDVLFVTNGEQVATVEGLQKRYPGAELRERIGEGHTRLQDALTGTLDPAYRLPCTHGVRNSKFRSGVHFYRLPPAK